MTTTTSTETLTSSLLDTTNVAATSTALLLTNSRSSSCSNTPTHLSGDLFENELSIRKIYKCCSNMQQKQQQQQQQQQVVGSNLLGVNKHGCSPLTENGSGGGGNGVGGNCNDFVDRGTDLLEPMQSIPSHIKRTRSSITGNNHHYITLIDGAPPNRSVNSKLYRICVKRNLYPNKIEITTSTTTTTATTTTTTTTTTTKSSSSNTTHRSSSQRNSQNTIKCEKKRYACSRCNKSYTWRCNLYRHIRIECEQEPKFICSQCNAKFYYRAVLEKHMNVCRNINKSL
ncbi:hypothetical protein GQX74_013570 [Glossina fuscipes]|nr:hypothetical protein GQX74_013570 [Glossina fuscipes]